MGNVAIVTGAGGGIGAAIAELLSEDGYDVAVVDINGAAAAAMADQLSPRRAVGYEVDVSDEAAVQRLIAAVVADLGEPNGLVNCAGISRRGELISIDSEAWNLVMNINLTGPFLCSQAVARRMAENGGGAIVNIASVAGKLVQPFTGAYTVSKAGLIALTKQMAAEWGGLGIRTNVVSPGYTLTPMSERNYENVEVRSRRENLVPLKRIGAPKEIASVVRFLMSGDASYVNGAHIVADGGLSYNVFNPAYSTNHGL
jgi:glucose 1-dehydrogenase